MSVSSTLPLNVAETGPIFILTTAVKPLSPIFSNDWQPGIADLSTSGSFSSAQTFALSAGKVTSPVIVIAMNVPFPENSADPCALEISGGASPAFRNAREISRRRRALIRDRADHRIVNLGSAFARGLPKYSHGYYEKRRNTTTPIGV